MSVTKSEAKAPRKSSHKSAASGNGTALAAVLAQTAEQSLPLSALVNSPLNVRTVPHSAASIRELAESIKGVGLLQNLVVHALPDGQYGVAAGARRLIALTLLADDGSIAPDWPVAVKVVPDELAVAASLTENGQRRDMHPAEQIAGFRAMAEEGKTPAQIGDLLGYGARHVQRMLKLAGLAPAIIDALARDDITTEHCQALALECDPDRQMQVYDAACQRGWNGKPQVSDIRAIITASEVSTNNDKFRFVGEAAFSRNEIRNDLFSDEQGGYVDAQALDNALLEKLRTVAEGVREAEGWAWCAGRMDSVSHYCDDAQVYRIQNAPDAVYTDEEQSRLNELQAQYDENDSVSDEASAMEAEMAAIECAAEVRAWTAEQRAASGVVVSWRYGKVHVQRGVMLREQDSDEGGEQQDRATATHCRKTDPADDISLPLLTKMSSERTIAVQAALTQQREKAVALLTWTLCLNVFSSCAYSRPVKITLDCQHDSLTANAPAGESGQAYTTLVQEKERLSALLPQGWSRDFTTFFTLGGDTLLSLMGFCVACSIDGTRTRECGRTSKSPLDQLETAIGFHLRDWWQPTNDNFFSHLKKPQIVAALSEAGLTGAARDAEKMNKGDAAALAESMMARTRWVPVWMTAPDTTENTEPAPDTDAE